MKLSKALLAVGLVGMLFGVMATAVVAANGTGGAAPAAPAPSAKQLLDEAKKLYAAHNYEGSLKRLLAVNRDQLGFWDKGSYDSLLEKAKKAGSEKAADAKALDDGKAALEAKKSATAVAKLSQAASSDYLEAGDTQKAKSLLLLAEDQQRKAAKRAEVLLEAGKQAYKDGRVTDARKDVQELKDLDVKLGRWDSRALADLERKLAEVESVPAKAPTAVATKPVEKAPVVVAEKPAEKAPVVVAEKPVEMAPIVVAEESVEKMPVTVAAKPVEEAPVVVAAKLVDEAPVVVVAKPAARVRAKAPAAGGLSVLQQAKRAEAEDELKLGDEAMAQHEIDKAKIHYRKALDLWPDSEKAKAGLQEAMQYTGEREAPILSMLTTANQVERQRVIADVQESLSQAEAAMGRAERPEDLNEALRPLAGADRVVDLARVLSAEEAERLREEVYVLRKQITDRKKVMEDLRTVQATREAGSREAARRLADKIERQNKIKQLWERATELRKSMQFAEAIQMLDRLIAIDPTDDRAQRWREDLLYLEAQDRQVQTRTTRENGAVEALTDTEESAVRPGERVNGELTYLRYPSAKSWKELTEFRREFTKAVTAEPKAVAETRRRLAEEIDLDFERTNLDNVLKYIAEVQRGLNIVVDPDIGAGGIDLSTRVVDLKVKRVSIEAVLNLILGADLGYKVESGYILVTTKEKMQQNLPMVTYPVQDLIATIPDFTNQAPRFEIENLGKASSTQGGGGGGANLFGANAAGKEEVAPIGSQELIDIIKRTVSATANPQVAAWSDEGGPAAIDFLNGLLIVTQTRKGHERLSDLLEQLRRERAIMISVEARFVTVSDDFLQDITLDVDAAIYNRSGSPQVAGFGNGTGTVAAPTTSPYDTLPGAATAPQLNQPISIFQTGSNGVGTATLLSRAGSAFANFTANEGGMLVSGVFLDDIQVGFLLRAIQADVRSTQLQAPRITMYNGQRSYITSTSVRTYISDATPVVAEAAVGWDVQVGAVPVGMTLDVKATVSADRRYVQMDLRPQMASAPAADFRKIPVTAVTPGSTVATTYIELPVVGIQDFKTTVSVPDGGTLLLGGTKELTEQEVETGVPFLSKIPILKRLFNNRGSIRTNKNLLILMRPKILLQAEEEHKLGYDNF